MRDEGVKTATASTTATMTTLCPKNRVLIFECFDLNYSFPYLKLFGLHF